MPAPATEVIRSSDGVRLTVHDLGGDGPVVLLAHATGFHGLVWSPLAAALSDSYRCVAIDFRGHGDSTVPDHGSFDWVGFADDVEAVIDHLGRPTPLWGIGHSKGGAALLLAEQRTPGTFAGLYLFEPIVLGPEARQASAAALREHPLATGARKRREVFASRDEAYRNYAAKPPLDALDPRALGAYVDHGFAELGDGTVRLKCRGENEAQVYSMSTSHTAFDHLDEVHCPVVIAAGSPTEGGPASFARPIADAIPQGSFEQHLDLGHFGPLEAPDLIARRAREAFSR